MQYNVKNGLLQKQQSHLYQRGSIGDLKDSLRLSPILWDIPKTPCCIICGRGFFVTLFALVYAMGFLRINRTPNVSAPQ